MSIEVTPEELRRHAKAVEQIGTRLKGAAKAGASNSMRPAAYGVLCSPLTLFMDDLGTAVTDTIDNVANLGVSCSVGVSANAETYVKLEAALVDAIKLIYPAVDNR